MFSVLFFTKLAYDKIQPNITKEIIVIIPITITQEHIPATKFNWILIKRKCNYAFYNPISPKLHLWDTNEMIFSTTIFLEEKKHVNEIVDRLQCIFS